jgi:ATP adenylyltransferase
MPGSYEILWAPWRIAYVRSLAPAGPDDVCFLCKYWEADAAGPANHVLWRGAHSFVALNRFPYNNGHCLIASGAHVPMLGDLEDAALCELMRSIRDVQRLLDAVLKPAGVNVGMNFGRCAGAGLPDHVHIHVVPRWEGDTNFMSVSGHTRVIPQDLDELYRELVDGAARLGLPAVGGSS